MKFFVWVFSKIGKIDQLSTLTTQTKLIFLRSINIVYVFISSFIVFFSTYCYFVLILIVGSFSQEHKQWFHRVHKHFFFYLFGLVAYLLICNFSNRLCAQFTIDLKISFSSFAIFKALSSNSIGSECVNDHIHRSFTNPLSSNLQPYAVELQSGSSISYSYINLRESV